MFALETLADLKHQQRLTHAARLQMVARARGPEDHYLDREAHRRITLRRLTAAPPEHQVSDGGVTRSR